MEHKVITRFAPSPTGFMHVGGVRTALYAWLWARKNSGIFILRIEDTDKEREVAGSVEHIIESLKWLGLDYDAGPDKCEPGMCYTQSERLELYEKYAKILIEKGHAYPDPYTREELETFRKKAEEEKRPFLYREHRPEKFGIWDGTQALRFKVPKIKSYKWNDLVQGDLSAGLEAVDDFILIKSDGYPTYNFAHIVDDIEMKISHVFRGQEFIASTPKFLSVYEALSIVPPLFVTTPPILGMKGTKKLSKRDGAKDILDYKKEGYLPQTMINYLAFLGFNPGGEKEVYTSGELISVFDLSKIGRSGAKWSDDKLNWLNKEHIKQLSDSKFIEIAKQYIDPEILSAKNLKGAEFDKYILLFRDRIIKFGELNNLMRDIVLGEETATIINDYLLPSKNPIIINVKLLIPKDSQSNDTVKYLIEIKNLIEKINWERIIEKNDEDKDNLWTYAGKEGRGKVLWPLRVALSGELKSPDPFEIMKAVGREATLERIENAIERLKSQKDLNTEIKSNIEITSHTFTLNK